MPFSEQAADRAIRFIERCCYLSKGGKAGQPYILADWQKRDIIAPLFGTLDDNGNRQYRESLIGAPRKSGKSTLAAAIALYLLYGDGEAGAEVVAAAASREQAGIVFGHAAGMVRQSPVLGPRTQIVPSTKRMLDRPTLGLFKVISSDANTGMGLDCSAAVVDELAFHKNRELYDTLKTSMGSRRQPLLVSITTASWEIGGIGHETWEYARSVKNGLIKDPRFFPIIWEADPDDDWTSPTVWAKVNPALGDFRNTEDLQSLCERAKSVPSLQNTFKTLYLNLWVQNEASWIDRAVWDRNRIANEEDGLAGEACYVALDLSAATDLTAITAVFPRPDGTYKVFSHCFIPEANLAERVRRDKVPYDVWEREGYLTTTPGNVTDYSFVLQHLKELRDRYDLREVAYDRWSATKLAQDLANDGFTAVPMAQTFGAMSPSIKATIDLLLTDKLKHMENPLFDWCSDCASLTQDSNGNVKLVKPDRKKATKRIDPIVAMVMALDRAIRHQKTDSDICWALAG